MKHILFFALFSLCLSRPLSAAVNNAPGRVPNRINTTKIITVSYTDAKDINPNTFTVNRGENIRVEVTPLDNGKGCMNTIMIPGLWNTAEPIVKGRKIVMQFTPQKPGAYRITCAMGDQRGVINVK
jgi:uncharacterized protein